MPIELFIEQWSSPSVDVLYPWSIWKDGKQMHYGQRLRTPEEAEEAFGAFAATDASFRGAAA